MEEQILDGIGVACWWLMFICPFIIIPLVWKFLDGSKMIRIVAGLVLSALCFLLLFVISMAICFRHGLGPV
ncbi:MAG TPA: hypothetical protein VHD83_01750 [Puia sp.]|nr:hypothetical protein [Puia sp.]